MYRIYKLGLYFVCLLFCVGCDVLVTTNPLVKFGGEYLQEGRYVLSLKDLDKTFPLTISYDRTNSIYQIDAGGDGSFQAACKLEREGGPLLVSLTASDSALKKVYGRLTESEGAFLARLYVTARLARDGIGYDVWLLNSAKAISDGCRVSGLPADRLLPLLPSTNAPPFVHAGKLFRIGEDGWNQMAYCGNYVLLACDDIGCAFIAVSPNEPHILIDDNWGGWNYHSDYGQVNFRVYAYGTCNHNYANLKIDGCAIAQSENSSSHLVGYQHNDRVGELQFEYQKTGQVSNTWKDADGTKHVRVGITVTATVTFKYKVTIDDNEVEQSVVLNSVPVLFTLECSMKKPE